jgi:hypothetical protein
MNSQIFSARPRAWLDKIRWRLLGDCASGRLPLGLTIFVSSIFVITLLVSVEVAWMNLSIERFAFEGRQAMALAQSLIQLFAIGWWGWCVMRACICRTGTGKSIMFSGLVFMLTLWASVDFSLSIMNHASRVLKSWHAVTTDGWTPLTITADPILGRIVVSGYITQDSDRLFKAVLHANPSMKLVQIESYGGYVEEAMAMARIIRESNLDTVTMRRCASACTLMFVAGTNRYLGAEARFRFHRSGYDGMPTSEMQEELDQELAQFYISMGAGPEIATGELATPFHSYWEPTQGELFVANYATLRWSERPPGM